jgi:hypothetical protein
MIRILVGALLAVIYILPAQARGSAYETKGPVEAKYQVLGPWSVTRMTTRDVCDRKNKLCDIWYPTQLGKDARAGSTRAFRHPVVSWANGTGQKPENYAYYLKHLASWGFIVVASRDTSTGNGATTEDAARYVLKLGETPSSPFYGKVDAANVGAAGHSQGGAAVTSLHARDSTVFKTYVAFHTSPWFFSALCCKVTPSSYRKSNVTASIFQWTSTPDSGNSDWYDPVPDTAEKAFALLRYTVHADIQNGDRPDCARLGCVQGMYPYLGYSTAWLMWRLQASNDVALAFRARGEFLRRGSSWSRSTSNIR